MKGEKNYTTLVSIFLDLISKLVDKKKKYFDYIKDKDKNLMDGEDFVGTDSRTNPIFLVVDEFA